MSFPLDIAYSSWLTIQKQAWLVYSFIKTLSNETKPLYLHFRTLYSVTLFNLIAVCKLITFNYFHAIWV